MAPRVHPFVLDLAKFAGSHASINPQSRVLVAVSGGPDSTALLLALCEAADAGLLPRPVGVAHFHHGLRGTDADGDAAFSAELAARAGLPCVIGLGAVHTAPGQSPNDTARRARYDFLLEAARDLGADTIATAHTLDDQAETVLGRVLRGTGLAGLAGIPPHRSLTEQIQVVRPLLSQRRAAVEAFCAERGITPRRDPSNDKERYARSRLRRRLPELSRDFNPRLVEALARLADQATRDNDLLNALTDQLWADAVCEVGNGDLLLDRHRLREAHPALRSRVLLRALRRASDENSVDETATAAFVAEMEDALERPTAAFDLPDGLRLRGTGDHLTLTRSRPERGDSASFAVPLPIPGAARVEQIGLTITARERQTGDIPSRERRSPVVDIAYNTANPRNLVVRSLRDGDRFAPLGMAGKSRAARDVMADAGWSAEIRARRAPLVARADTDEILWIVGLAQSESTRVTADTAAQHVLRLTAEWDRELE